MFEWIRRLGKKARNFVLPEREEKRARNTEDSDLGPYTPEPKVFLGQLAYIQLSHFEILTNELKFSPTTSDKAELSEAAAKSFQKYRSISKTLSSLGFDVTDAMDPFTERIETFHSRTSGIDWYEAVVKVYLVGGLLEDFYKRLAIGLPEDVREGVEKALRDTTFEKFARASLVEAMKDNPQLASRLALWGRRLMGDVLLELRAAFDNRKLAGVSKGKRLTIEEERRVNLSAYSKLEPLITELIAAHSLRMDAIGLAA
jgi:hypothetical protein